MNHIEKVISLNIIIINEHTVFVLKETTQKRFFLLF